MTTENFQGVRNKLGVSTQGARRKTFAMAERPKIDRNTRTIPYSCISRAVVDMDDEVVLPGGLDTSYFPERIRAVYVNHDYDKIPVGSCTDLQTREQGRSMFAQTYIAPGPVGDDLLTAIEAGAMGGYSVGFKMLDFGPPTREEIAKYGPHKIIMRRGQLIEYSFVAMPCCPDALINLVGKGYIRRENAVRFGMPDTAKRVFHATTTPKSGRTVFIPARERTVLVPDTIPQIFPCQRFGV
jgi:HK97 family phage prohead protease